MKKSLFYLFMLMAVAAMPLTSCEKDPQKEADKHDPNSDADQTEITAYDALNWLQGSIVVVNNNGDVVRRVYGEALDESQPDVISAPAAGYAAAEKIFLSWVAPGKEATKVDGGYDYNLTDYEGKAQGSVSFRSVEDGGRVIARMTVAEGTNLKEISEFNFIDSKLWPENAAFEKVEAGKIYEIETYELKWEDKSFWTSLTFSPELKKLPFYCIKGNTDGEDGILIWISPDSDTKLVHPTLNYYLGDPFYYLPTVPVAKKVLEFYNNNATFWNNMLKEMDAKGYEWSAQDWDDATGNSEFVLQSGRLVFYGNEMDILDLDKRPGKISYAHELDTFWYRYMLIETIPAVE